MRAITLAEMNVISGGEDNHHYHHHNSIDFNTWQNLHYAAINEAGLVGTMATACTVAITLGLTGQPLIALGVGLATFAYVGHQAYVNSSVWNIFSPQMYV